MFLEHLIELVPSVLRISRVAEAAQYPTNRYHLPATQTSQNPTGSLKRPIAHNRQNEGALRSTQRHLPEISCGLQAPAFIPSVLHFQVPVMMTLRVRILSGLIALLMGTRSSEITKRLVRDVDLDGTLLRITKAKTKKGNRVVSLQIIPFF